MVRALESLRATESPGDGAGALGFSGQADC
jgi:hypothetical protein